MRYPKMCNWILLKRKADGSYLAKNFLNESEYSLGEYVVKLLRRMDGKTDPFSVLPDCTYSEVQEMLRFLKRNDFVRYGRVRNRGKGSVNLTLFVPKKCRSKSLFPVIANFLLMVLWLPVFVGGLWYFFANMVYLDNGSVWLGQWVFLVLGAILHEVAHALAALGYGGRLFEGGVMLLHFMPGAYVMIDDTPVKSRLKRAQILAAGVEMNMLLSGIAWFLTAFVPSLSGFFAGGAVMSLLMAIMNLCFADGLDGAAVMGKLLGLDYPIPFSKYFFAYREEREKLFKAGFYGYMELAVCCLMWIWQIVMPLFVLLCILGVFL